MQVFPDYLLDQVGLRALLEDLAEGCAGEEAKSLMYRLQPLDDLARIEQRLARVAYFMQSNLEGLSISLVPYHWPADFDRAKHAEGYVYELETIVAIKGLLHNSELLRAYRDQAEMVAGLTLDLPPLPDFSAALGRLERTIDVDGSVRTDATPELVQVHRQIDRTRSKIDRVFEQMASQYGGDGLLSEIKESYRDGRRVLAMPVENKRKVQGVLHGASESGRTVYLEPIEVTEVNNQLVEWHQERQKLIYELLRDLSAMLMERADEITLVKNVVCLSDLALAIARISGQEGWHIPTYDASRTIHLIEAYHPILDRRLLDQGQKTVRNDILLRDEQRVLVVSGPNAGGKSVLLKSVALCQLMYQSGLPIPASADSRLSVYRAIVMDMGDQQSIKDDLSTYSAHLTAMSKMLSIAGEDMMFFIDEMGTGTDPRVGGALAEEILHHLVKKGSSGIVTTHYPNLKSYAHRMKGVVNGSMRFDMDSLRPMYQLSIGKPGSSFAFEIARRIGLPNHVLSAAKKKTGGDHVDLEKLLEHLEHKTNRAKELESELLDKQARLDRLIAVYDGLKKQLDVERRRVKAESKAMLSSLKAEQMAFFKQKQKELEASEKKADQVKALLGDLQEEQRDLVQEARAISEEADKLEGTWVEEKDLSIGDHIKLRQSDTRGEVVAIKRGKVRVAVGEMTLEVPLSQIMKIRAPIAKQGFRGVKLDVSKVNVPNRLDLRGMSYKEAEATLQQFLDDALVAKMSRAEVLHGRGSGALQKLVRKVARSHPHVAGVVYADEEAGGDGLSLITFG